jgi:hypothetical protein
MIDRRSGCLGPYNVFSQMKPHSCHSMIYLHQIWQNDKKCRIIEIISAIMQDNEEYVEAPRDEVKQVELNDWPE